MGGCFNNLSAVVRGALVGAMSTAGYLLRQLRLIPILLLLRSTGTSDMALRVWSRMAYHSMASRLCVHV